MLRYYFYQTAIPFTLLVLFLAGSAKCHPFFPQYSYYQTALKNAGQHNYKRAIDQLKAQIEQDSTFTEAYVRLANFYRYAQDLEQGEKYFQAALQNMPQNPNDFLGLAAIHQFSSDWKQAFDYAKSALDKGSTSPTAVQLLVESAIRGELTDKLPATLRKLRRKKAQKHFYDLGYAIWRYHLGNFKKARTTILSYLKTHGDPFSYNLLGEILFELNDFRAAIANFKQSQRVAVFINPHLKITQMQILGKCFFEIGKVDSAQYYFEQAFKLAQLNGALFEQLQINKTLSHYYKTLKWFSAVEKTCGKGIEIATAINELQELPELYFDRATATFHSGDYFRALKYLTLSEQATPGFSKSRLRTSISLAKAQIYIELHDWQNAQKTLHQTIKIADQNRQTELEYQALFNLADVHQAQGEIDSAKTEYKKVLWFAERYKLYHIAESCLVKLADLNINHSLNLNDAKYYLTRADALARQTLRLQYIALIRYMQGEISLLEKNIEKAETYFLDAIQLGKDTGSYDAILAGNTGLIKTYLQADFAELAATRVDTVIDFLDDYRNLCSDQNMKQIFNLKSDFFIPAITACYKIGHLKKIFDLCEKYKATQHIHHIAQIKYTISSPENDVTKYQIENLTQQIQQKWNQLWDLWRSDNKENLTLIMQIKNKIKGMIATKNNLQKEFAQTYPAFYSLTTPTTESLEHLRQQLVKHNASFLHYVVGEEETNILLVRADSIFFKQIPIGRAYLTRLIEQIHPLFSPHQTNLKYGEYSLNEYFRLDLLGILYNSILKPIKGYIPLQNSLFVSTDDILKLVPFECLVTNKDKLTDNYDFNHARFLIEDYAITYLPYAKFLNWPYKNDGRTHNFLIAFSGNADTANYRNETQSGMAHDRFQNNHTSGDFKPIENSDEEIMQIAQAVGMTVSQLYTTHRDQKDIFVKKSPDYKLIHLATHGAISENSPLYSKITFGRQGEIIHELEIQELFNLKLNAELAVLSNLEREFNSFKDSNGLSTLVHAFNYAGVPTVATSLWTVPEKSGAELLSAFYANLKMGMTKAEALRQAKITFIKSINSNPYLWSRFILLGLPGTIQFENYHRNFLIFFAASSIVVLMILVFLNFRRIKSTSNK
ncbi:MAG: CHAT domain-containing protein [bacterium]